MTLDAFIQRHIRRLERHRRAAPDLATCVRVEKVSPNSVAAAAGIGRGDLVAAIDGKSPSADDVVGRVEDRSWMFFRPATGEAIELDASGIDLGLQVAPTPEAVMANLERGLKSPLTLLVLWEQGRHAELERVTRQVLGREVGLLQRLAGNLRANGPQWLLRGAALYELGKKREGLAIVHDWVENFEQFWTQEWMGVSRHYLALEAEACGEAVTARELREEAVRRHPESSLLARAAGRGEARRTQPWVGQRFPVRCSLCRLDNRQSFDLRDALAALGSSQFLVVCSLASYRGNGPYNDFMRQLPAYARHFAPYWGGLCVLTMEPARRDDRPHWYEAEDRARAAGVPFDLLLEDGELTEILDPPGSPHFFFLAKDGTVLEEGAHTGVDVWSALAAMD